MTQHQDLSRVQDDKDIHPYGVKEGRPQSLVPYMRSTQEPDSYCPRIQPRPPARVHETTSSSPPPQDYSLSDVFDDVPASSTPDMSSPNSSSCASEEVPLTQIMFTNRLHALLQVILDQQRDESPDCFVSYGDSDVEKEWITVSQRNRDSSHTLKQIADATGTQASSDSSDDASSSATSASNLGVWAPSPPNGHIAGYKSLLTQHNKRKHDQSSDDGLSRITSPAAQRLASRKKAKLKARASISSFSYQSIETASNRKLRSLTSTSASESSSSLGSVSGGINKACCFSHPIIHPPQGLPNISKTRAEVAGCRLQALLTRERSYRIQDGLSAGSFGPDDLGSECNNEEFGIEADFRREVVQWILDILPPRSLRPGDLYRHLKCSEETRFHAMYLFSRYILRVGGRRPQGSIKETSSMKAARRELIWDVAFCCLAISTKFYHDFLYPLYPICNRDFLTISPQILSSDQFEYTQRDILAAFDYEIHGVTPHAFFEELWAALPSLQEILDFGHPRQIVCNEMWTKLQRASLQWDIMRFPISLLSAAALIEGVILALIKEYQQEDGSNSSSSSQSSTSAASLTGSDHNLRRAYEDVRLISRDVALVLGVSTTDLRECRRWMALV